MSRVTQDVPQSSLPTLKNPKKKKPREPHLDIRMNEKKVSYVSRIRDKRPWEIEFDELINKESRLDSGSFGIVFITNYKVWKNWKKT